MGAGRCARCMLREMPTARSKLVKGAMVTVVAAGGCAPVSGGPSVAGGPNPEILRPDEHGMPEPIMIPVIEKVCKAAPCSGKLARLVVFWKDTRIVRYLHHGDLTSCSHPPS